MLIVCPNCATSYRLGPESLGETGRSVRCVSCHHVWFEEPRHPEPETTAFPASAEAPATGLQPPIRPPLNDVVHVGSPPYSQEDYSQPDSGDATDYGETPRNDFAPARSDVPPIAEAQDLDISPSIVPGRAVDPDAETNVERVAARRSARRKKPARRWFAAFATVPAFVCLLILTLGGLVFLRQQVVRHLPQTASLYALLGMPVNLRGLQFDNIKTVRETQEGVPVLVVEGEIKGTGARLTEVPRLRFAVLDRNGKEIYAWTARPERTLLPPGETLPFRSRLASPPAEASGVTVRFFNRRDAQAGIL